MDDIGHYYIILYRRKLSSFNVNEHRTWQHNIDLNINNGLCHLRTLHIYNILNCDKIRKYIHMSVPITQIFLIADKRVSYQIPSNWSINKIKCLLCTEFASLRFDTFEIMLNGHVLTGDLVIGKLQMHQDSVMVVMQSVVSKTTMQEYYSRVMKEFMVMDHSMAYNLPVMHRSYQNYKTLTEQLPKDQQPIMDGLQQPRIFVMEGDVQILQLFKILRYMGWLLFIMVVITRGYWMQISIIFTVILSHHYIEHLMKQYGKQKEPKQEQIGQEKRPDNTHAIGQNGYVLNSKLKSLLAEILLRLYKLTEILFCVVLTLFPNSDINLHFLVNSSRIEGWRDQINRLRPGSFTGKWTIK